MWDDPIVAEVHRAREKLAAEHNFDIGAYFADVRKRQTALAGKLVPQLKQPASTGDTDREEKPDKQGKSGHSRVFP